MPAKISVAKQMALATPASGDGNYFLPRQKRGEDLAYRAAAHRLAERNPLNPFSRNRWRKARSLGRAAFGLNKGPGGVA